MQQPEEAPAEHETGTLEKRTRFYYGFGSVAYGIKDNGFGYFLLIYYNQVLGLPATWASQAIFIALLLDAFSDPIVGNVSDRLHSRLGRRHPFMYAAAIPVALSFYALWNPPALEQDDLFVYLLVNAVLVRTFITFYEVPSTALAPELTSHYDERTRLASARHFFGWAGGIGIAVFAYLVLFEKVGDVEGQLLPEGYQAYGVVGATLMAIAILVSAAGTHRHIPDLMSPPPRRRASLTRSLEETRETLNNRSFLAIFGFGIFAAMAGGLSAAMNVYLYTFFWGFQAHQIGLIVPSGLLSATIAFVAAPRAAMRFGKKRAAIGLSLCAASFAPTPYLARFAGVFPENGTGELLMAMIAYNIIEVAFIITSTTLVSAMMADVVEESELETGRRSEGIFFAARSFISKSLSGLGIVLATALLAVIDFPTGAQPGEIDPLIIRNLGLGYFPMIVVLYFSAIACLAGYQISREQHAANVAALRKRREPTA
ncbi:MAG: MFS transporter [Myxococcota bacterium]|jgi:Na+/melibiose symporter-like transporter|nr:MFS transporter [Myxococcota bacterium]